LTLSTLSPIFELSNDTFWHFVFRLKDAEIFAAPKQIKNVQSSEDAYEDSPDEFDMDRALLGEEKETESVFKNSMAISIFMPLIRYYLRQGRSDKVYWLENIFSLISINSEFFGIDVCLRFNN
jgi:hypothetical protein